MLNACFYNPINFPGQEVIKKGYLGLTLTAPMNPNTLRILAKWRYHPKLLARWNGSSGSWWNSIEESVFERSVAIATANVMVLFSNQHF